MLVRLRISNFAIIRHLDMCLRPGLNILSGETGAGKSIIINAVDLILGGRASSDLIRSGCKEAGVEALFSIPDESPLHSVLSGFDIPFEGELLIKRTISREGRNRISINGSMATLQMLTQVGEGLIGISGQHEHHRLLRPDTHLHILDDFGGLSPLRLQVGDAFGRFRAFSGEIRRREEEARAAEEREDLARFQIQEIERAGIRPGEEEVLSTEKKRLRHAEALLAFVSESYQGLYEDENSTLSSLSQSIKRLERGMEIDPQLIPIGGMLREIQVKLEDAAFALRDHLQGISLDPGRLEEVTERLQLLSTIKRKYGSSLEEIVCFKERLASRLSDLEERKRHLSFLKESRKEAIRHLQKKGGELSAQRRTTALALERAVERELRELHMSSVRFQVRFRGDSSSSGPEEEASRMTEEGLDRIEFMISPNLGEDLRPLAKIASGGELSRVMLALKTILAKTASVETLVFDEVDAGISGAAAEVVGEKILSLSSFHQILCITHLPQIASKGETHFQVRKEVDGGRTHAVVSELDREDRVREIARLLAGREVTARAVAHAREMLGQRS